MSKRLTVDFYIRENVVKISRELLGKRLVTQFGGQRTAGCIVETEAYRGPEDKASHAYSNRYTKRTKIMFARGGHVYVYLCYGIHHLFNIVTAPENIPHAVLIRAIEPVENLELMLHRRKFTNVKPQLTAGPGVLTQALGVSTQHTGLSLTDPTSPIWIEDWGQKIKEEDIIASPRVGVAYAQECALWPWRFRIKGSKWVSPAK